jgi:hypothetical protein
MDMDMSSRINNKHHIMSNVENLKEHFCKRKSDVVVTYLLSNLCLHTHLHLGESLNICMEIDDNVSKSTC